MLHTQRHHGSHYLDVTNALLSLDIISNDEISQNSILGNLSLLDHSWLKNNFGKSFILVDDCRRGRTRVACK